MSKFLKKLIFGLDISDVSIEVLELTSREKLKSFGRITIEEGIVRDGFVLDKKKLAEKIKLVLSQAKIKTVRVILSLPESKVFIHIFRMPKNLRDEELKSAVESEAEKTIPLEPSRIYWNYQVVSPRSKDNQQLVLFVGTLKEVVDDYIEVLDEVGLEPVAFEIESMALGRALLRDLKLKAGAMIVDIGTRTTNISIFDKNSVLRESTTVPVAGDRFTKAIANKLKVSPEKAEKLKRTYGLDEKKEKGKTATILEKELQPIIKRIKKSIEYYSQEIEEVFLVGGSARIPKITNYLSLNLGLKVKIGISSVAGQLKRKSVLFNPVIGLALRGLEKNPEKAGINLLPEKARPKSSLVSKKTRKKKYFPYLGIGFIVLALIFLAWVIYTFILKPLPEEISPPKISPVEEELPPEEEAPPEEIPEEEPIPEEEEEGEEEKVIKVIIQETGTGWLNVREGPSTNYSILTKIYPGESYPLLAESNNWYKIELTEGEEGWIASRYTKKIE